MEPPQLPTSVITIVHYHRPPLSIRISDLFEVYPISFWPLTTVDRTFPLSLLAKLRTTVPVDLRKRPQTPLSPATTLKKRPQTPVDLRKRPQPSVDLRKRSRNVSSRPRTRFRPLGVSGTWDGTFLPFPCIRVGGSILGVRFLDPLAGLVVSGMILKAGLQTGYQSILELVDAAIPSHHLDPIRKTVLQVKGVEGCRHLRGRRAGSYLHLDVKIEVDPLCSIKVAHQIGESVRFQIQNSHPEVSEVFIQLEPITKQEVTEVTYDSNNLMSEKKEIEEMVTKLLASKFREKVVVTRITKRKLQDKSILEIEVSMRVDAFISDAMEVPEEFRSQISNSMQVTFQLPEVQNKE